MSVDTLVELHGVQVLDCAADGPRLRGEADAADLIGNAMHQGAELVVVPVERLPDDFFALGSGVAGALVQKFVNYRMRLAVIGDISSQLAGSSSLRAFVAESNRGRQLWFVADRAELTERLPGT